METTALVHKLANRAPSCKTSMRRELLALLTKRKGQLTREEVYIIDKYMAIAKVALIEKA